MACTPWLYVPNGEAGDTRLAGVAGLAKLVRDPVDGELLAWANLVRSGVNLGGVGEDRLLEPLIHDALVLDVEKRED